MGEGVLHLDRTITSLTAQKKNPGRINVFLDGEFAFGLDRFTAAWLRVGEVLSEERITQLQAQDGSEIAYQKAVQLIGLKPRTRAETRTRLEKKGLKSQVIDGVLTRLAANGLISDSQYAQAWVENRAEVHPRSRRLVERELLQKGIAPSEARDALQSLPDDQTLAYQFASAQARRLVDTDFDQFQKKLSGQLLRKGFDFDTTRLTVQRLWKERDGREARMKNEDI